MSHGHADRLTSENYWIWPNTTCVPHSRFTCLWKDKVFLAYNPIDYRIIKDRYSTCACEGLFQDLFCHCLPNARIEPEETPRSIMTAPRLGARYLSILALSRGRMFSQIRWKRVSWQYSEALRIQGRIMPFSIRQTSDGSCCYCHWAWTLASCIACLIALSCLE